MLQHPASFQTAVQGLFMAQRQAVASETPGCGQHLCFIGSGREQEDQYVHMVVASFLQRNTQYISLAKGGYHGKLFTSCITSICFHSNSSRCHMSREFMNHFIHFFFDQLWQPSYSIKKVEEF